MTLQRHQPAAIIIYSRDEMKQWEMAKKFVGDERCASSSATCATASGCYRALDGVDYRRPRRGAEDVPAAEYNPFECVKTNMIGADERDRGLHRPAGSSGSSRCRPTRPAARSTSTARPSSLRQAVRRRQLLRRRPRHAVRRRALRQRHGLARLGDPVLPVDWRKRRRAADHRRAHDPLHDHARAGRRVRAGTRSRTCAGGEIYVRRSRRCG